MDGKKIIIIGGGHLQVQEILDRIWQEALPVSKVQIAGEGSRIGEIQEFKDEPALVIDVNDMAESEYDCAFMLSKLKDFEKVTSNLVLGNIPLVDLSGQFMPSDEVPLILPDSSSNTSGTLPMISILPSGPAHVTLSIIAALADLAPVKSITGLVIQGVSQSGSKQVMDELFDQTRAILGFQDVNIEQFSKQIAFNLLHTENQDSLNALTSAYITDKCGSENIYCDLDLAWGSYFVGLTGTLWLELTQACKLDEIEQAIQSAGGFRLVDKVEGVLDIVGRDYMDLEIVKNQKEPSHRLTLRFAVDNLRRGLATSVIKLLK